MTMADSIMMIMMELISILGRARDAWSLSLAAMFGGHGEAIRTVFECGIKGAEETVHLYRQTLLHAASLGGQAEVVRVLQEHGADATAPLHGELSAMELASMSGHVKVARSILEHGAPATTPTKDGSISLHLASALLHGSAESSRLWSGCDGQGQK